MEYFLEEIALLRQWYINPNEEIEYNYKSSYKSSQLNRELLGILFDEISTLLKVQIAFVYGCQTL